MAKDKTGTSKVSPDQWLKRVTVGGVVIIIGAAAVFLYQQFTAPLPGTAYPIQGREHIPLDAPHLPYNSNPPTSGPHYESPVPWGVYDHELPDEQLVHNLEHGGVWVSYNCDKSPKSTSWIPVAAAQVHTYKQIELATPSGQASPSSQSAMAKSSDCQRLIEDLTAFAKKNPGKMILAPRAKNDLAVAAVAWGYLQTFDHFDESALRSFYVAHKDKAPEVMPD